MELLDVVVDSTVIVVLAVLGAVLATVGGLLGRRPAGHVIDLGCLLLWAGYAVSFASLALFVIAGFLAGR